MQNCSHRAKTAIMNPDFTVSNIDLLKLFATLSKKAYPLICLVSKCRLPCPPSQSDCEELFVLLVLYQGILMYMIYMYISIYDFVHTICQPTKLTHTYLQPHIYAQVCRQQGKSRTHGGQTLHSSKLLSTRQEWENWVGSF